MDLIIAKWNYLVVVALMMIGLFIVMSRQNLVKKLIGLTLFQTAVFLFYISLAKIDGGTAPIIIHDAPDSGIAYSNPLPHVLILTAIVVAVGTTALGLALVLRINDAFGSIEEDEILSEKVRDYARPDPARRGRGEMKGKGKAE